METGEQLKYTYLYQDRSNQNCSGEIDARNRADAYTRLRKMGIRPYRVIGDDPFDWQPIAFWVSIGVAAVVAVIAVVYALAVSEGRDEPRIVLTPEEAADFRKRAEDAVYGAPEAYRNNVWRGVNARLKERGLEPIPMPLGMVEEDAFVLPRINSLRE